MKNPPLRFGLVCSMALCCQGPQRSSPADRATLGLSSTTTSEAAARQPAEFALGNAGSDPVAPAPRGRWRLMTDDQLLHTLLWVSHILIRHRDVVTSNVSFSFADWKTSVPLPARSREEARTLAESIAQDLQKEPSSFGAAAARYSEDEPTRTHGGSLGGNTALNFVSFVEVMDALSALAPGGVSRVVETPYGFHILQRQPAPAPDVVSGRHLVIGYDDAGWLRNVVARRAIPHRTRETASALARSLFERAQQNPSEFGELIDQYSEHDDAAWGGNVGQWYTREPSSYPRELQTLQALSMGEISEPLDSVFGFETLQRTRPDSRAQYAMAAVVISFDATAPEADPSSRARMAELAASIARDLAANPDRLLELQHTYCCADPIRFEDGPEWPHLVPALSRLAFGDILPAPVESGTQFVVARRIDPEKMPPVPMFFDFSYAGPPNTSYLLGRLQGNAAREQLREVAARAPAELGLNRSRAARLVELHEQADLRVSKATSRDEVRASVDELVSSLGPVLGSKAHSLYRALLDEQVERFVMSQ